MKCIIADDSKIIRMVLSKILRNLSFEVIEAEDGEDVIEKSNEFQPSLIIMDWYLPVMSGIDVLHKIRNDQNIKQPKVMFCCSTVDINHISEALHGGADDYLLKPFDEDIIKSKLIILGLMKE